MELVVNGVRRVVEPAAAETLATTLRERLHLTGTKVACGRGECGTCTVLLEGEPVYSCLTLTRGVADGAPVTTIEGLGSPTELHPVQRAFIDHDAVQCGFCTPGQVLAAAAFLAREGPGNDTVLDDEAIRRAMSGNLCRCGTYPRIVAAIRAAAQTMRSAHADPPRP
ncbi:MAG TPA: (2Fe-2S)-binding protein [Gemmatimonadaceae bacterium]|nr:(2Fe-2S)-binding protein [Gemmatimonadaceae bacterium]